MSRFPFQVAAGLLVLIAGLAVVYTTVVAPEHEQGPVVQRVVSSSSPTQVVEMPPPTLEGVDPVVQRVLFATGRAEAFTADELTQLPAEVARVLVFYGTTITVPIEAGAEP
ncbi:MAG TPA: hypothetical protein VLA91_11545 [Acidimicrobiia bacterium]|nr:hypothetical protein [Acidimicrobiia bacterium]